MFVQNHHSLEELQRLTKALTKKRIWLRHQAVVLAKQGHSAPAIARALGCSSPRCSGLSTATIRGAWRPSRSGPHRTPAPPGCGGCAAVPRPPRGRAHPRGWRLHLPLSGLAPHPGGGIRREFHRQAIDDLLHRLDYSSLMPRPQHEQANPEVQEFFKEIVVEQIDAIAAAHPEKGGSYLFSG